MNIVLGDHRVSVEEIASYYLNLPDITKPELIVILRSGALIYPTNPMRNLLKLDKLFKIKPEDL